MDANKKLIRDACKKAYDYLAWRNPLGVWFVTLFEEPKTGESKDEALAFFEFQFTDSFPARDKRWVWSQIEKIKERRKDIEGDHKDA